METNHCPNCHAPIPANAPGGFCPACLLRDAEEPPASGHSAPPIEEIAAAFPQLEVTSLIGQGGMGFVYKVRQPSLDRVVALKILSPELGRDPAFAERFAREARTLGKLHHPNIVTVFEHGEAGGFFYLIMEYVDGVNLRQAMRAGRFTPQQALAIVPGICDALQYAHEQGVWHRDIKPENILLDRDGKVKIADFGIARIVGNPQRDFTLTMTGNALGSAAYMAPEQHEKPHDVDHRADIYSLGVVIYEMLTGELPLGRFPSPSQRTAVDARIDEIVFKTLEKERDLRQQSATEVKTDMHRAMQPGVSQKTTPATSSTSAKMNTDLAIGIFLFGITFPFLLWNISEHALGLGIILSFFIMQLSRVFAIRSSQATLIKVVGFSAFLFFLLSTVISAPLIKDIILSEMKDNAEQLTVPKAPAAPTVTKMEKATPPRPVMQPPKAPAAPTVTVEEVFRKMVAAANDSDGEQFRRYTNTGPFSITSGDLLMLMKKFLGEVETLKVTCEADTTNPEVYVTMRGKDGSKRQHTMKFAKESGQWILRSVSEPRFKVASRIEFKPQKGDAVAILRAHMDNLDYNLVPQNAGIVRPEIPRPRIVRPRIRSDIAYRPVRGQQGIYEIYTFADKLESLDGAKLDVDNAIPALRESLKPFGLDTALKVISPAVIPEAPYMAEDEPPFVEPKP